MFFIFFFGIGFHWSLLLFPLAILGGVLFGTTLGLFITPLGMLYKDIGTIDWFWTGFFNVHYPSSLCHPQKRNYENRYGTKPLYPNNPDRPRFGRRHDPDIWHLFFNCDSLLHSLVFYCFVVL